MGSSKTLEEILAKRQGVYVKAEYEYKPMDDAPYELDARELRDMQRMERALSFIISNLTDLTLTSDSAAACAGMSTSYFERYFRSYFEMPFQKFVTKLRLRQAARDIKSGEYFDGGGYKKYGFSMLQAFSRAFRRELGISIQDFRRGDYEIPGMPDREQVKGIAVSKQYIQMNATKIRGIATTPVDMDNFFMLDNCACMFFVNVREALSKSRYTGDLYSPESGSEIVGTWWYIPDAGLKYIVGRRIAVYDTVFNEAAKATIIKDAGAESDPGLSAGIIAIPQIDIVIQGGNYVMFSCPRPNKDSDIPLTTRILWRYIFKEWMPVNQKKANRLGCSYEVFSANQIEVYIPLLSGLWNRDELKPHAWSIANWAGYIDDHITEGLSLESLAHEASYSPQNYKEIFSLYYGITPTSYIRRRRIVLASNELAATEEESRRKNILRRYRFYTMNKLKQAEREEFGTVSADEEASRSVIPDLNAFYDDNIDRVKSRIRTIKPFDALLYSVTQTEEEGFPDDIVERVLYYFHREFDDYNEVRRLFKKPEEKIFIWGNIPVMVNRRPVYQYYIGSVVDAGAFIPDEIRSNKEGSIRYIERIEEGKYAVFSSYDKADEVSPTETFRLLVRCAFGGWIHRNRWRVDMHRRTFIMWRNHKLFFYVPLLK